MEESLFIKNMVCARCIEVVRDIFQDLDLSILELSLGEAKIKKKISQNQINQLNQDLIKKGFELLNDKQAKVINQIKMIIIDEIQSPSDSSNISISSLLTSHINYDYAYLSRLFSSLEGRTIEKYAIALKVEKVKELLIYGEMTLSEIAFKMKYSSSAHLSSQFKKVVGMSPSEFKKLRKHDRKALDKV